MKWIQNSINISKMSVAGMALLLLLTWFSATAPVSAAEQGFTMSLRPSSVAVNPGDIIQLAVQVHNDGWPDAGEAEVAAFQAMLEYDHNALEFQSVDIPEGTMGDFRPDSGMVLGYGEGHVFQENYDCAVLTMKVSESAGGDIPVAMNHVVLGKQDATGLTVSAADPLILNVGGEDPAVEGDGNASGSSGSRAVSGTSSGSGGSHSGSGQDDTSQNNVGQGAASGQSGTEQAVQDGSYSVGSGDVGGQVDGSSSAASEGNGTDADVSIFGGNPSGEGISEGSGSEEGDGSGDVVSESDSGAAGSGSKESHVAVPVIVIAGALLAGILAAAGLWQYRKRKHP